MPGAWLSVDALVPKRYSYQIGSQYRGLPMSESSKRYSGIAALVLLMATYAVAQTGGAMLFATGKVNVNGIGVPRSTNVLEGDVIETASDGTVTVAGNGTSVLVQNNSMVIYSRQGMSLANGSLSVKTSEGMIARVGSLSIQPVNGAARYRVAQNGGNVQVDVLEGNVTMSEGGKSVNLASGRSATMPCTNCSSMLTQATQARDLNKARLQTNTVAMNNAPPPQPSPATVINPGTATTSSAPAGGTGGAAAGGGSAGGGLGGMNQTALIIGAAAAAGGIAAAVVLTRKSTSP